MKQTKFLKDSFNLFVYWKKCKKKIKDLAETKAIAADEDAVTCDDDSCKSKGFRISRCICVGFDEAI